MKTRTRYCFLALLVTLFVTGACNSSSDDSYTYTSNCAIKGFTLGKLVRTVHVTTSAGLDSTYNISFNGSLYPLTIDQVRREIYNSEHFPNGTILKTLATITADGPIVYAPEADTTQWVAYSASDSIDFSQPLVFRVYAYDGSGYSDYRMNLNVRTDKVGEYTWQQLTGIPSLVERRAAQLLVQGNDVVTLSAADATTVYCARTSLTNPSAWTEQACVGLPSTADVLRAVCYKNQLWMSTESGQLARSTDGINWTEVAQEDEAVRVHLVTASETVLHAVIRDTRSNAPYYMASSTDGVMWTPISMEQMVLPMEQTQWKLSLAAVAYKQDNGNHRVMLCADVLDDESASLLQWSLLEDADESWIFITDDNASDKRLPRWTHPILLAYNNFLYALGGGQDWKYTALDTIYVSFDNGLNWYSNEDLTVPEALVGTTAPVAATTAGEYILLMAGDQFWRVRYNDYGQ